MQVLIHTFTTLAAFLGMELVAWFTHKYIMHGWLWVLHKDHHRKYEKRFEKNDWFFLIFALPSCLLLIGGIHGKFDIRFWIGLGIALYGLAYFFIHDLLIHQRIKIGFIPNSLYLKALKKAHEEHHVHKGQRQGECYGMLFFPYKYYVAAKEHDQ